MCELALHTYVDGMTRLEGKSGVWFHWHTVSCHDLMWCPALTWQPFLQNSRCGCEARLCLRCVYSLTISSMFWVFFFWPHKVVLMCLIRPAHIWTRFWSNKDILACISWCSCIHVASILLVEYEVLCVSVKLCFFFYLCWMDEISWSPEFPRFLLVAGIQWFSGCWWRTTLLEWQRFWWESSDCGVC